MSISTRVRQRGLLRSPSRQLALFAAIVLVLEAVVFLVRLDPAITPFVLVCLPPAAAVGVSALSGGYPAVARLLRRVARVRIGWRWFATCIGIPVGTMVVVDLVGCLVGQTTPQRLIDALNTSALVVPLVVLLPALLEELGWRGFGVQTSADAGHSPARAALTVGAIFFALHVPLYLPGQMYAGLPFWPLPIVLLGYSVLLTWTYLRTGSVLAAGLMHASFNAAVPLGWGIDANWIWQARAVVVAVVTAAVVARTGVSWWLSPPVQTRPGES